MIQRKLSHPVGFRNKADRIGMAIDRHVGTRDYSYAEILANFSFLRGTLMLKIVNIFPVSVLSYTQSKYNV